MKRGWTMTLPRKGQPVGTMQRRGGEAAAPPFDPSSIAGLVGWYKNEGPFYKEAARTNLVTADQDLVGAWDDSSGVGNHLTAASATVAGRYKTNVRNGRAVVRMDGLDDYLQKTFTLNQPCTVFMVWFHRPLAGNRFVFDGAGAANKGSLAYIAGPSFRLYAGATLSVAASAIPGGKWHVTSHVLNGATSELWLNGVSLMAGAAGATNPGGITLGPGSLLAGFFAEVDYGELLVYTGVLSTTDRQAVENYLTARWNAGAKDPSDVAGLRAWWRSDGPLWKLSTRSASSGEQALVSSDPVGCWDDRSGNGSNIIQSTSGKRPTLQTGQANGLPVVRFDGGDDGLSASITGIFLASACCIYAVFRTAVFNNMTAGLENANTAANVTPDPVWLDGAGYYALTQTGNAPRLHAYAWDGAYKFVHQVHPGLNTWIAHRFRYSGALLYAKVSGQGEASVAHGTRNAINSITIGQTSSATPFNGDVAEIICFNVMPSADDLAAMDAYIANRYGITW